MPKIKASNDANACGTGRLRKKVMGKILVALSQQDRVEEVIPCIEKLATPGTQVVFLVRYPVESWPFLRDHWVTTESARDAMSAGRRIADRYSWEAQRDLAIEMVTPARVALREKKVEVDVYLYSGSLGKTVRDYGVDNDIHWIVTKPPGGGWIDYLFSRGMTPQGWSICLLSALRKQEKTMPTENTSPNCTVPIRLTRIDDNLHQVVHGLKNCMHILIMCVGDLEAEPGQSVQRQQSLETLQNRVYEMNSLVDELIDLAGKQTHRERTDAAKNYSSA